MYSNLKSTFQAELDAIESAGIFKKERIITTPQDAVIRTMAGGEVLTFESSKSD
jgi:glycine C-acetyltransferase